MQRCGCTYAGLLAMLVVLFIAVVFLILSFALRSSAARSGFVQAVLVDPDDPGYAELPGSPSTAAVLPPVFLAAGAFLGVVAVTGSALITRSRRRRMRRGTG